MAPIANANMQHLSGLANMGESSAGRRGDAPRSRPALRRREISLPDVTYCGAIAGEEEDTETGSGGEPWDILAGQMSHATRIPAD